MPASVKISDLPVRAQVVANDRIPVVDAAETQTATATAAQIAAIGGGPPGNGSVTTVKLADNSVTYAKIQQMGGDKLLGNSSPNAATCSEITCTAVARSLLAAATKSAACAAIGAAEGSTDNPSFTGQVTIGSGTAGAPSLSPATDPDTGILFPSDLPGTIAFSTDGVVRVSIGPDGRLAATIPGAGEPAEITVRPAYFCRAWGVIDGGVGGSGTIVLGNQLDIGLRYSGQLRSLLWDTDTRQKVIDVEAALNAGATSTSNGAMQEANNNNKTNYTNTTGKKHWKWNTATSSWTSVTASGKTWIGKVTITIASSGASLLSDGANVAAVSRSSTGVFVVTFENQMPDTNYAVIAMTSSADKVVACTNKTATAFTLTVKHNTTVNSVQDDSAISFIVIR